jgi:hypothetical protein
MCAADYYLGVIGGDALREGRPGYVRPIWMIEFVLHKYAIFLYCID